MESHQADLLLIQLPGQARSMADAGNDETKFKAATRIQESLTAPVERRVLGWLAARLPPWVKSDHLTALGFAAMFLAGASYAFARISRTGFVLASIFLAVNWFGDSLDGTLARIRNQQRPRYGFYVDHVIDTFGALFVMSGLAFSGFLHWQIAFGMLVAFLMLSIEAYLATYTLGTFQMSYGKFGPTEIRLLLVLGNAALWFHPTAAAFGSSYRLLDVGGAAGILGMSAMLVASAVAHTAKLYREETIR